MKFELGFTGSGRRNLIIAIIALVVIASITAIIIRYQSRSTYQFPPAPSDTPNGTNLTTAIAACTTNYRQAIAQGLSDSPEPKSVCVQNAVNTYFTAKCPFVTTGSVPSTSANPPQTQAQVDAYNQYAGVGNVSPVGGDAAAVTSSTQYINLVNAPGALTAATVTRARKADLTGPTRKYIETACPGFYKPADVNASDFTSIYTAWGVATGASAPTTAGEFGFYAPSVTTASVTTWASYAATPITVTSASTADASVTTTKTLTVTGNFPTVLTNAKVKVTGITGVVLGTTTAASPSSIVLTYPSQIVPIIAAGAAINMSTASAINSVTFPSGGAPVPIPNTTNTPTTAITSVTLALGSALDSSLVVGSQVLISGSTISGQILINSITNNTTIVISFPSQVFPILPTGSTIESIIETPYAMPLVAGSTLYNKIGTMAGQKMFNWQIAQVIGPGTYWNNSAGNGSAIAWGA